MFYRVLADATVLVHFLWVAFLVAGGLWGFRRRTVRHVHVAGLGLAIMLQILGWYCPLTYLEVWLRTRQSPGSAYAGSFIAHYAERLVYMEVSRGLIFSLTLLLCAVYVLAYLRLRAER